MSVRMIRWSVLAAAARLGMVSVFLLGSAVLGTPDALADTGGDDDTADSGGNGEDGSDGSDDSDDSDTSGGAEEGGDTSDTGGGIDSGSYSNGYQGLGPAELANELGGGCGVASQSASFLGLMLCLGTAGRRREEQSS